MAEIQANLMGKILKLICEEYSADTVAISLRSLSKCSHLTLVYPSGKVAGHLSHKSSYT